MAVLDKALKKITSPGITNEIPAAGDEIVFDYHWYFRPPGKDSWEMRYTPKDLAVLSKLTSLSQDSRDTASHGLSSMLEVETSYAVQVVLSR